MSKPTKKVAKVPGTDTGATESPLVTNTPSAGGKLFDPREFPQARAHGSATRQEIRETTHRVMGSRQSAKPVERGGQRRQPKTGGTGGHGKKSD